MSEKFPEVNFPRVRITAKIVAVFEVQEQDRYVVVKDNVQNALDTLREFGKVSVSYEKETVAAQQSVHIPAKPQGAEASR